MTVSMQKLTWGSILALSILPVFPIYAAPNKLTLTCSILDPISQMPKLIFASGEKMLVKLNLEGPNDGNVLDATIDKTANISLAISAKLSSIKIPFRIQQNWSASMSEKTNTDFEHFQLSEEKTIVIPNLPSKSKATVKIGVNVRKLGKRICSNSIKIQ